MQNISMKQFLGLQMHEVGGKFVPSKCLKDSLHLLNYKQRNILSCPPFTGSRRSSSTNASSNSVVRYWRSLKWVPIPLSVGFAYICYQQYGHIKKRENRHIHGAQSIEDSLAKDWQ